MPSLAETDEAMPSLSDRRHPIWKLLSLLIVCSTILIITWLSCSKFDGPDIARVLVAAIGAAGYGEIRARLTGGS